MLKPGETSDHQIDCLQLTIKRQGAVEDEMMPDVTLGEFDTEKLFRQAFLETGVDERVLEKMLTAFNERAVANHLTEDPVTQSRPRIAAH